MFVYVKFFLPLHPHTYICIYINHNLMSDRRQVLYDNFSFFCSHLLLIIEMSAVTFSATAKKLQHFLMYFHNNLQCTSTITTEQKQLKEQDYKSFSCLCSIVIVRCVCGALFGGKKNIFLVFKFLMFLFLLLLLLYKAQDGIWTLHKS